MGEMEAGAASAVITPPLGIDLTGYGGRPGPSSTVYDDLYARAVVLGSGDQRLALVGLDLIGLAPEQVAAIREQVHRQTGIGAESLLLNCSHTHAGPAVMTLRGLGERDAAYEDLLCRVVAGVVSMAAARLAPARLAFGTATARVGANRRRRSVEGRTVMADNPEGSYDPGVPVVRIDGTDGQTRAVLFSHACHPVILGNENTGISADLPGPAAALVREARIGGSPSVMPLFLQGCCADINPIRRGDLEAIRRSGRMLGAAAVLAAEGASPLEGLPLGGRQERVTLPLQPPPSPDEARAIRDAEWERVRQVEERLGPQQVYALRQPRAMLAWAEDLLRLAEAGREERSVPVEVQTLRIGDLAIVAIGGETFLDLGRAVAARSPAPQTLVLGYSNGLVGYLPTAASFPEGGYEVDVAYKYFGTLMVTDACEELLVSAAARHLADLWSRTALLMEDGQ